MRILAIETSCDETAITLLEASGSLENLSFNIISNSLLSQIHIHKEYGGVYPMLAKREHQKNLPVLLDKTLKEANVNSDKRDIDFIAVTEGPGLEPALWTGIVFAEELGRKWHKPVVPINHMEGHIYSVLYGTKEHLTFPSLALLVSGGHTELVLVENYGSYKLLGKTRDDAVGEAFDKVGRLLDLPYPGGPKVSALAAIHREKCVEPTLTFPKPMVNSPDLDFSYSGLKTAVLYTIKKLGELTLEKKEEIARAFEDAAIGVLIGKTRKAIEKHPEVTSLIVGGGVSANNYLRENMQQLSEDLGVKLFIPERELSTDNAVMIGITSYIKVSKHPEILGETREIRARGNLAIAS
jgi:N6-L-threonylcarbamoyladenine synthase